MKTRNMAEAIILQSIEDLWDKDEREECIKFFSGENFRTCAAIAGLGTIEQIKILRILDDLIKVLNNPIKSKKDPTYEYSFPKAGLSGELVRT